MRIETLCIVYQPPRILLGIKKRRFGKDKYNGFGGGIEKGESLEQTAIRETQEEAGITIQDLERVGELLFQFETGEQDHLVNIYMATRYSGEPKETEEMAPEWFEIKDIPYEKMWEDDRYWLPLFLQGKKFRGHFIFGSDNKIKTYTLNEVTELN